MVSIVKQLAADDILLLIAMLKLISWQIRPRFKNKSEWTSTYVIQSRSELVSECSQNDKIISLTNLFQHLLSIYI